MIVTCNFVHLTIYEIKFLGYIKVFFEGIKVFSYVQLWFIDHCNQSKLFSLVINWSCLLFMGQLAFFIAN